MIYLLCAMTKFSVVFCQQVQTILVHADTLAFGIFGQSAMQGLGKPQFELTGILLVRRWLRNFIAIGQCGCQPLALAVLRVFQRRFCRFAAGQAAAQLRIRGYPFEFKLSDVLEDDTEQKVILTPEQEERLLAFMEKDKIYR